MKSNGLDDPILIRDVRVLARKYFKKEAWFDLLANFPIYFYLFINGFPDIKTLEEDNWYLFCMSLKILRLYHILEVFDSFKRLLDKLGDIFYLHRYMFVNF